MNDLYNRFGNQPSGPFANLFQRVNDFKTFAANFKGDPGQTVQQMLNNGQITQEQLNRIMPIAQQFYNFMNHSK